MMIWINGRERAKIINYKNSLYKGHLEIFHVAFGPMNWISVWVCVSRDKDTLRSKSADQNLRTANSGTYSALRNVKKYFENCNVGMAWRLVA